MAAAGGRDVSDVSLSVVSMLPSNGSLVARANDEILVPL
jgi:hypothetical protein